MRSSKPRRDGIVFRSRAPPSLPPSLHRDPDPRSLTVALFGARGEGDPVRVVGVTIIIIVVLVVFR